MAIEETFRSEKYDPAKVDGRFVQQDFEGGWKWIETQIIGKWRYDVRKGTCAPSDLPEDIMNAALDLRIARTWPPYVEWPR